MWQICPGNAHDLLFYCMKVFLGIAAILNATRFEFALVNGLCYRITQVFRSVFLRVFVIALVCLDIMFAFTSIIASGCSSLVQHTKKNVTENLVAKRELGQEQVCTVLVLLDERIQIVSLSRFFLTFCSLVRCTSLGLGSHTSPKAQVRTD